MAERETEENSCRKMSNSARRRNRKVLLLRAYVREDRESKSFSTAIYFDCNIRPKSEGGWRKESGEQQGKRVVPASVSTVQSANHPAIQPVGQPRSRESQRRVRRPRDRPSASLPWAHVAAPRAPLAYISDRSGSRSSCKWVGSNDILTCPVDRARSSKWMVVWLKNLLVCCNACFPTIRGSIGGNCFPFDRVLSFSFFFLFLFFFCFFVKGNGRTTCKHRRVTFFFSLSLSFSFCLCLSRSEKGDDFWKEGEIRLSTTSLVVEIFGFTKRNAKNWKLAFDFWWFSKGKFVQRAVFNLLLLMCFGLDKRWKGAMRHDASSSSARCLATRFNPQLFYFFIYFFLHSFYFFPLFSFLFFRLKRI